MSKFDELLKELRRAMVDKELTPRISEAFSEKTLLGTMSRLFDKLHLDSLYKGMISDLPETIFNSEPLLNPIALVDPTDENHEEQKKQYDKIKAELQPYLDMVTYKISQALLASKKHHPEDRTLQKKIKKGLYTNYASLEKEVGHDELIEFLYSAIFNLYTQGLTYDNSKRIGIKSETHGSTQKLTPEQDALNLHFACIAQMINEYTSKLSIQTIKECSSDKMNEIGDMYRYGTAPLQKNLLRAIDYYVLAKPQDPERLLKTGVEFFDTALENLKAIMTSTPQLTAYKHLNTLCDEISKAREEFITQQNPQQLETLLQKVDNSITEFERVCHSCKTEPNFFREKIRPLFKAMLGATILLACSISIIGAIYLSQHKPEREAFIDSFFHKNKNMKKEYLAFKSSILELKNDLQEPHPSKNQPQ